MDEEYKKEEEEEEAPIPRDMDVQDQDQTGKCNELRTTMSCKSRMRTSGRRFKWED